MLRLSVLLAAPLCIVELFSTGTLAAAQVNRAESPIGLGVLVSSSNADEAASFSKSLVLQLQRSPELAVKEAKGISAEQLRASAASEHYTYLIIATFGEKKRSLTIPNRMIFGRGGSNSATGPSISWTLEKAGNPKALYSGQLTEEAKSKNHDPHAAAAENMAAIAGKIIEDDQPHVEAKSGQSGIEKPRLDVQTAHATQVSDFVYSKDERF